MVWTLVLLSLVQVVGSSNSSLSFSEVVALSDFFFSTNGPSGWINKNGWSQLEVTNDISSINPCASLPSSWYGVSCIKGDEEITYHVAAIHLPSNNLSGHLPASLCNLTYLENISVAENRVSGDIPSCFGEKQSILKAIDFSDNLFTGRLPESICQASELQVIDFSTSNLITGTLMDCISTLRNLSTFFIQGAYIYGTIPNLYCQLSKLEAFSVTGGSSTVLGNVSASKKVSGTIPACLFDLASLDLFNVEDEELSGHLPSSICGSNLTQLALNTNQLSGNIPECIGSNGKLTFLDLGMNRLSGTIPTSICHSNKTVDLSLSDNSLTGSIPPCFGSLTSLEYLNLGHNQLTNSIPYTFCNLTSLVYLLLRSNLISGNIPPYFGTHNTLMVEFVLEYNSLSGLVPESLCNMESVTEFRINNNKLSGHIPSCFGQQFTHMQSMLLQNNQFGGRLPPFWHLPNLQVLYVSNNVNIHGELPQSLFHQQGDTSNGYEVKDNSILGYVVLEGTSIKGSIPDSVCKATALKSLLLSGNQLSGSLPNCMTQLKYLTTFHAPNNQLSGHIMPDISNMSSLTHLDVSQNRISGTVPESLGDMSFQLVETNLFLNQLSCDLPQSVLEWNKASGFEKFDILEGNLFSCPEKGVFALSMTSSKSKGLREANKDSALFYSCGGSDYVIPVSLSLAILTMFLTVYALSSNCKFGGFTVDVKESFFKINPDLFAHTPLKKAYFDMKLMRTVIILIALTSLFLIFPVVSFLSRSYYTCQYMDRISLSGKDDRNQNMILSIIVGVSVGLCCIAFSAKFYNKHMAVCCANEMIGYSDEALTSEDYQSFFSSSSSVETPIEEEEEESLADENGDNLEEKERHAKNDARGGLNSRLTKSLFHRLCELVSLLSILTIFSVGPNILYVYVTIGEYSSDTKVLVTAFVAFLKAILTALIIPTASDKIADCLFPTYSLGYKFRSAVNVGVFISAFSLVLAPIIIVGFTDTRCLKYYFKPQSEVNGQAVVRKCEFIDTSDESCMTWIDETLSSSYTPHFAYDGGLCVSAVISTYTPVFLAHVLLSTPMSAALELVFVPLLAPWCFEHRSNSKVAKLMLQALKLVTFNVPCLLSITHYEEMEDITARLNLGRFARSVMRRAHVQFASSLLLVSTFGLAAPLIGGASIIAALVHFRHQTIVLSQLLSLGELYPSTKAKNGIPNIKHCSLFPRLSWLIVTFFMIIFWCFATIDNLKEWVVLCSFLSICFAFTVVLFLCIMFRSYRFNLKNSREDRQKQSSFLDQPLAPLEWAE